MIVTNKSANLVAIVTITVRLCILVSLKKSLIS